MHLIKIYCRIPFRSEPDLVSIFLSEVDFSEILKFYNVLDNSLDKLSPSALIKLIEEIKKDERIKTIESEMVIVACGINSMAIEREYGSLDKMPIR